LSFLNNYQESLSLLCFILYNILKREFLGIDNILRGLKFKVERETERRYLQQVLKGGKSWIFCPLPLPFHIEISDVVNTDSLLEFEDDSQIDPLSVEHNKFIALLINFLNDGHLLLSFEFEF